LPCVVVRRHAVGRSRACTPVLLRERYGRVRLHACDKARLRGRK
jgi:hypothetical protein